MKVTIAGMGLLGGALGLALRQRGVARVHGLCRREEAVGEVLRAGAADEAGTDPRPAMIDADLLVLCVPVDSMASVAQACLAHAPAGLVVTDVGSVKRAVVDRLDPVCRHAGVAFVGAHPMAGSDRSGLAAAAPDLFEGATVVLTPTDGSDPQAVRRVAALWEAVGAVTLQLDPATHDAHVGRCSHVVHIVAAALVHGILGAGVRESERLRVCGTGFRDTTRVAMGAPGMWTEISAANADEIEAGLREFEASLAVVRTALRAADRATLERWLSAASRMRAACCPDPSPGAGS